MATFVLVHGLWHGGWCWQRVASLLAAEGHKVYTPTLTGLGDRSHLASSKIGLETHILDIVQLLEYEDLNRVVLVGHSYAGMVLSGVAEQLPERLSHLVYLDALCPENGQSVFDLLPGYRVSWEQAAETYGQGYLVPPPNPEIFGVTDPSDIAWMLPRLTPVPLLVFTQPVQTPTEMARTLPCSFIRCTVTGRARAETRPLSGDRFNEYELATGHNAMITAPAELAELLVRCAICLAPAEMTDV